MLSTQPTLLANDKNQTARFDTIVVLSHECPFISGQPSAESYLEREMQVLAEHADRVIVFAHEGWFDGWPIKAGLPENVSAFGISDCATIPSESFAGRLKRLGCLAKHLGAVWSERRRITSRETLFAATSFLQLGDMKAQRMLEVIAEQKIVFSGRVLLYSYWFNEPILAMQSLARRIEQQSGMRPVCISRAHGYDCYDYRSPCGYNAFKRWMAEKLDAVLVCSQNGANYLKERDPEVSGAYRVGRLGTADTQPQDPSRKGDAFSIVCCSRAVSLKRVDRVIDALLVLEERGHRLRFTFIGDGDQLGVLKEKAALLKKTEVDIKGALPNEKVFDYYSSTFTDLFVNASEYEGIPLSIMEALSFGIPVVATNVGGVSEIIHDGVCGKLIDRDFTDEDLADAIEAFVAMDEKKVETMRAAARRNWEQSYRLKTNAEEMLRLAYALSSASDSKRRDAQGIV